MIILLTFLTEDYSLGGFFPDYDSLHISLNHYTASRYPLFVGCFRGFCLYAGTYGGQYEDSTFYLRDHVKIVDTASLRKSAVQEWAVLNRFFRSSSFLFSLEVGLVKEVYSSVLKSYNDVFPNNRLSLGKERRGTLFGGALGYFKNDFLVYALIRYRIISKDSSISSGDTTGWVITVPAPPKSDLEILLSLHLRHFKLNLYRRDGFAAYMRSEGKLLTFPYVLSAGYSQGIGPMMAGGVGADVRDFRVMFGGSYVGAFRLGLGLRYPVGK